MHSNLRIVAAVGVLACVGSLVGGAIGIAIAAERTTRVASAEIALTLTNGLPFERKGEPVRCGVPLVRGFGYLQSYEDVNHVLR